MTVAVVVYPGVSAHEAVGALSACHAADIAAEFCASDALVHARDGARLVPHRLGYASLRDAEAVILPGGNLDKPRVDADLARALRARRGMWLAACGESLELATAAGLADARRVAVAPGAKAPAGTTGSPARLVVDGRLLTCRGGDATTDLVLHLVACLRTADDARRAAERLGRQYSPFVLGADAGES